MSRRAKTMAVVPAESSISTLGEIAFHSERTQAFSGRRAVTLADYVDAIYRRRWWIAAFAVCAVFAAAAVSRRLPRSYEATATLDVERVAPGGLVGPETSNMVSPDMDQLVATHMRMLQSDSSLRPVADQFGLYEPASKGGAKRGDPIQLKGLKVVRPPNTYLIQVTYRAPDPELAAAVANRIARSYVDQLQDLRKIQWRAISESTRRQISGLKERMEQSNRALLEFQRQIGMVDPEDKTNVMASRLIQLNTDFARAQSDRAAKEALYETLASGPPEAAETSQQGEQLKRLLERKSEAQQKFADVRTIYGERNAEYQRALAQLREIETQLRAGQGKVIKRAESEWREARLREANINRAYRQAKGEADAISASAAEYRLLRQRADADRVMYDELSRKVGEAEINAGLRTAPVRMADPARPDSHPASPNSRLNCAAALLGALAIGCIAAIVFESRRDRFRTADDLRAACGVEVVTVLPTVKCWRGLKHGPIDNGPPTPPDVLRFREQIKRLRNVFNQAMGVELPRVIVVVSPSRGDGRSRVAAEFALAYSALGQRTLLMDADLRSPGTRRTGSTPGLSTALAGEARWRETVVNSTGAPDILPSGPKDDRVSELVHQRFDYVVDEAVHDYDTIVIDSPPFLRYSESLDIVRSADAVIVLVRAGHTDPQAFETMLRYLRRMNARIGAVVLNDAD